MMSLNRVQLIGNLTRDPELRTTASGQSVVNFGIATNRQYKDASGQKQDQAEFHNVVAWGKLADICSQYLTKGRQVFVEGRLQTREWQGQDSQKRRTTEVVAENMIMLGGPAKGGATARPAATPSFDETPFEPSAIPAEPVEEIQVEDIPF